MKYIVITCIFLITRNREWYVENGHAFLEHIAVCTGSSGYKELHAAVLSHAGRQPFMPFFGQSWAMVWVCLYIVVFQSV
jgi:hypothetical protein